MRCFILRGIRAQCIESGVMELNRFGTVSEELSYDDEFDAAAFETWPAMRALKFPMRSLA